jgi:hypothetical protein
VVDVQSKMQALLACDLTNREIGFCWFGGSPDSLAAFARSCLLAEVNTDRPKAVEVSLLHDVADVEALSGLSRFRDRFYDCLDARADALFELADAVLCTDGPVTSLAALSLAPVFRRGHGALYDALAEGAVDEDGLRDLLAGQLRRL